MTAVDAPRSPGGVQLPHDDVEFFYEVFTALLEFVNRERRVAPGVSMEQALQTAPEHAMKVLRALWADDGLRERFVSENPAGLSPRALALVASWRHRVSGSFFVFRQLKKHAIFLLNDHADTGYGVLGLRRPIEENLPFLPCLVTTVLLPFEGRIVYDSLLAYQPISFGGGVRRMLADSYRRAKLVTSLGPPVTPLATLTVGPPAKPSKPAKPAKPRAPKGSEAAAKTLKDPGRCEGCGAVLSKRAITRHVAGCATFTAPKEGKRGLIYQLMVDAPAMPEYWMVVEAGPTATLKQLDKFLRDTWLECCGHLSAFTIGGQSYASQPDDSGYMDERTMSARVAQCVGVRQWRYEYDFGSTTELRVRVLGSREGSGGPVTLLARNLDPPLACVRCGAPATKVCMVCNSMEPGWLCAKCAKRHECEDAINRVVNSPRCGVCGYP